MTEKPNNPINAGVEAVKDAAKNMGGDVKAKAQEVMAKVGVTYEKAVEVLERNGLSVINAIIELETEAKNKAGAYWDKSKEVVGETVGKVKTMAEEKCTKENAEAMWRQTKECLATPIEVCNCGGKKIKMPAAIVGAGVVSLMYPLHKSKTLSVLGAAGVGAYLIAKNKGAIESKLGKDSHHSTTAFTLNPALVGGVNLADNDESEDFVKQIQETTFDLENKTQI